MLMFLMLMFYILKFDHWRQDEVKHGEHTGAADGSESVVHVYGWICKHTCRAVKYIKTTGVSCRVGYETMYTENTTQSPVFGKWTCSLLSLPPSMVTLIFQFPKPFMNPAHAMHHHHHHDHGQKWMQKCWWPFREWVHLGRNDKRIRYRKRTKGREFVTSRAGSLEWVRNEVNFGGTMRNRGYWRRGILYSSWLVFPTTCIQRALPRSFLLLCIWLTVVWVHSHKLFEGQVKM